MRFLKMIGEMRYSQRELLVMTFIFAAFIASAQLGRLLFTAPAVIQPAVGIALASLILGGVRLWPAVAAAAAVNILVFNGAPFFVALGGTLAHTTHAVVGAGILRALGFDPVFRRLRDMFMFMGVALLGALVIPIFGFAGTLLNNTLFEPDWPLRSTFLSWWAGTMIANLGLVPFIVRWIAKPRFERTRTQWLEIGAALFFAIVLTYSISWIRLPGGMDGVLLIVWFAMFLWFGIRLGTRFTFLAYLLTLAVAITGILYGSRAPIETAGERLVGGEVLLAAIGVVLFTFLALVEERRRASNALRRQLERVNTLLDESKRHDNAKSEFIAVFAHELRNPLAPIVSSLELLKLRWGAHPEIAPLIDTMEDRTKTVVRLLDDLLDISRISRQAFKLKLDRLDLGACVQKSVESMRALAHKHGLALEVIVPDFRVPICADPVRIEQMIGNLLMNAVKYTESGGRITLAVDAEADTAVLRVRDTGIGIAPEMLSRIFQPFAGLGVEHRQHTIKEGLGIGLWLTENLVKAHGGTIAAASKGPGRGSEFTIRLPLNPGDAPLALENPSRIETAVRQGGTRKVLVVDDNEAAAKGLGVLLEYSGNTIALAFTGADAIEKTRSFEPEAIVLDIGLPDLSGYDVAQALRSNGFDGTLIALTGYGQEEDKRKAVDAGFDHHLTKPVGIADLQAVLSQPRSV